MEDTIAGNPDCEKCPLHRTAQYVCLMGRGRIPSKIMIVGEAPGEREDDVGKPFQGRSGKLLEKMLAKVGVTRDQVYITNAVKCRPPENRTPKASEVKECRSYLEEEIEEVRPKFILLLGATALKAVLGKAKITEIHGEPIVKGKITYFPTFHPSAALRDPKRLPMLEYDFHQFGKVIRGEKIEKAGDKFSFTLIEDEDTFVEAMRQITLAKEVAWDTETTSLNRFGPNDKVNVISWTLGDGQSDEFPTWVLPLNVGQYPWVRSHKAQKEMVQAFYLAMKTGKKPKEIIAQNGKYDDLWLDFHYGVRPKLDFDTMLAAHLLDENLPSGLKFRARHHLKAPNYDIDTKTKTGRGDLPTLYLYAALDPYYTIQLKRIYKKQLKEDEALWFLFKNLVMKASKAYEQVETNGVYIVRSKMDVVKNELGDQIDAILKRLRKHAGKDINWNSPQQVNQILFKKLKLKPLGRTPGGEPSTAENLLTRMRDDHPIINDLLEYRGAFKLESSFIEGWENRIHDNYWLHPSYKLNGTVTGRPSCEDPNLQQVPRNKVIRSLVGAPEGWTFFEADYSQVELRVAAMLADEPEMKRIFQTGGDIHTATAALVMGCDESEVSEEDRKKAKAVNFGFLYGMGWKKFIDYALDKYGVVLTDKQSKDFRKRFFERYSALLKWHDRQRRVVSSLGQVRTLTGRIRHLSDIFSEEKGIQAQAERNAINSPVQGFAAEMTLMAMVEAYESFDLSEFKVCGTIHDAMVGRVKTRRAPQLMRRLKDIMEAPRLLDQMGIELTVPIVVDVKLGNWGNGVKVNFT